MSCLRTFWAKDSFLTGGFCRGSVEVEVWASKDDLCGKLVIAAPVRSSFKGSDFLRRLTFLHDESVTTAS